MNELTGAIVHMARNAGALLASYYGKARSISHKGAIDLVTSADHAAEDLILHEIAWRFPGDAVLAEETGAHNDAGARRWVVDPLDGTVNFAHGLPHFATLIAVEERQADGAFSPLAAVTFDPLRDELFVAEVGQGATLNGAPIHVSSTARLIDAVLATGFGYERLFRRDDNHAEFCRLNLLSQGVRRCGSAGLDLAYVACGRLDAFWEYALKPWDVVGGCLLAREAGGQVSGMGGGRVAWDKPDLVVSNGALHPLLVEGIRSARQHAANSRDGLEALLPSEVVAEMRARGETDGARSSVTRPR